MTTFISFLSGWGLLVSILAFAAGCVLRLARYRKQSALGGGVAVDLRARLVPLDIIDARWPTRVVTNDLILLLVLLGVLVAVFAPGHAIILGSGLGMGWPDMSPSWSDALTGILILAALFVPARHLMLTVIRKGDGGRDWAVMALVLLLLLTGLLARLGVPNYGYWLLLHLVCGHVFLWCAPHCRYSRLLL